MGTGTLIDTLTSDMLFVLGVMLLAGCITGVLAGRLRLPEITGFVLAGVLIGDSGIGLVPRHMTDTMRLITEMALGLIALTIGSEFALHKLRQMGRAVIWVSGAQLLLTFLLVLPVMRLAGLPLPFALIIASIATASSPAVIVAVVQHLRARGPFVDCLYGVVALLDAGTVICFGVAFSIAAGMMGLAGDHGTLTLAFNAIGEVIFSVVAGILVAGTLHLAVRNKTRTNEIMLIVFGLMFVVKALANALHLSTLLIMMTVGAVMINLTPRHHRVFRALEPITPPLYALFFVLAGSELQLNLLRQPTVLGLGVAYLLMRTIGKVLGSYTGAVLAGAPPALSRNIGWCMLPQAGVSLGLVLMVQASPVAAQMSPVQTEYAILLANIVLLSVFVNQLIGPSIANGAILRGTTKGSDVWT